MSSAAIESEPADAKKGGLRGIALLFIAVLVALSYYNAPPGEFVWDDVQYVANNSYIQNPALYGKALTSDVWAFRGERSQAWSKYYRPTFTAWTIVGFKLFGLDPTFWHVLNILGHLAVCFLAYFVLLRLGAPDWMAAVAAWIFAAHPVHVESVTWISGMTDPLMAVFFLGSYLTYLKSRQGEGRYSRLLSIVCYALALGSKEPSVALIPLVVVTELFLTKDPSWKVRLLGGLKQVWPYLAVTGLFVLLRNYALGSGQESIVTSSWTSALLSAPQNLLFYLRQAVWPMPSSPVYDVQPVTGATMGLMNFWLPMLVIVVLIRLVYPLARTRMATAIGLSLFLLPLLPTFDIRSFHPDQIVRDRYLYLPLLGVLLILVDVLRAKVGESTSPRQPLLIFGGAVSLVLALLCSRANETWLTEVALWQRGVAAAPRSGFAYAQLGEALRHQQRFEESEAALLKAIELNALYSLPRTALGMLYRDTGRLEESERVLQEAYEKEFDRPLVLEQMAGLYQNMQKPEKAIEVLRKAIEIAPWKKAIHLQNIGVLQTLYGEPKDAIATLEEAARLVNDASPPAEKRSYYLLGELYLAGGRDKEAREAFQKFIDLMASTPVPAAAEMIEKAKSNVESLSP